MITLNWRRDCRRALALMVAAIGFWLLAPPRQRLSNAIYKRISIGMSLMEVEELINGAPSNCIHSGLDYNVLSTNEGGPDCQTELIGATSPLRPFVECLHRSENKHYTWRDPNRALMVAVDSHGTVCRVFYTRLTAPPQRLQARGHYFIDSRLESWFEQME